MVRCINVGINININTVISLALSYTLALPKTLALPNGSQSIDRVSRVHVVYRGTCLPNIYVSKGKPCYIK
jgi:hypothetical protein